MRYYTPLDTALNKIKRKGFFIYTSIVILSTLYVCYSISHLPEVPIEPKKDEQKKRARRDRRVKSERVKAGKHVVQTLSDSEEKKELKAESALPKTKENKGDHTRDGEGTRGDNDKKVEIKASEKVKVDIKKKALSELKTENGLGNRETLPSDAMGI